MRRITADGAQEALVELTGYLDSGVIDADGMDLKNGTLDRGDGTAAVYAIPADTLAGLSRYGNDPKKQPALHPDIHEERGQRGGADRADAGEAEMTPSVTPTACHLLEEGGMTLRFRILCNSAGFILGEAGGRSRTVTKNKINFFGRKGRCVAPPCFCDFVL